MKKIMVDEIDFTLQYEGYYWYSNEQKPKTIMGETISKDIFKSLPFIIEGNFYCSANGVSISIKNFDGVYQIYQATVNNLPNENCAHLQYITHDLEGYSKIKMLQYWAEGESDELLAGMTTLIPAWQAFKGFIK